MCVVLMNTVADNQVIKGLPAAAKAVHSMAYEPFSTGLLSDVVCLQQTRQSLDALQNKVHCRERVRPSSSGIPALASDWVSVCMTVDISGVKYIQHLLHKLQASSTLSALVCILLCVLRLG